MPEINIKSMIEPSKKTLVALLSRNLPPDTTKEQLDAIIEQEIFNFEYLFALNPQWHECLPKSVENAFRKTIMQNLSFDQDYGLVWCMDRRHKIGQADVKLLECNKTVNGWISMYKMTGSLRDVDTSGIEFDNITSLVKSVTIKLICPKYNTSGEITGEDIKSYTFTRDDWRVWQKAGHKQATTANRPGSMEILNNANENYWNYMPKNTSLDVQANAQTASGANPTSGPNPGFITTKCTFHALKKAKLERNPYARKFIYVDHKRYVDDLPVQELLDEIFEVVKPVIPDFPNETHNFPEEVIKGEVKEEIKKEETIISDLKALSQLPEMVKILTEAEDCNTGDEVMSIYNKYKIEIDGNAKLKEEIGKIGKDRRKAPRNQSEPVQKENHETNENVTSNNENVTSDDL